MRSTPAPASASAGCTTCRSPAPSARAADLRLRGLLVGLLLLGLLAGCSREVDVPPPSPTRDSSGDRSAGAQAAVDALDEALTSGTREQAESVAGRGARDLLGAIWDNVRAVRVDDLTLRYVDEAGALSDEDLATYGPSAWRGSVQLTYAYAGVDAEPARLETQAVFVPSGRSVRIVAFGGTGTRTPLWLLGPLAVQRGGRTLVLVEGSGAGAATQRFGALAARALQQVGEVLPRWRGTLVLEVPEDQATLDELVQAAPGQYDDIAAVTTTADGSLSPGAPVRVFVNPVVFDKLKPRGAQVVVSHETTHVAVGAPFSSAPTWLAEGFADYVALHDGSVPVQVAASQILARIKAKGVPDSLPTPDELSPTATGLGATYEEAWLACRFLGQELGTAKVVAFYRAVDGGASTEEAFRSVLGTTQARFVADWRRDLARLAGVAG